VKAPWLRLVAACFAVAVLNLVGACGIKFGELGTSVVTYEKCDPGKTYVECHAEWTCLCGPGSADNKRDYGICSDLGEAGVTKLVEDGLKRLDSITAMTVTCVDTGKADIPTGGLKPLAWGDDKCKACVASHCPVERENCDADDLCVCLDQCQVAYPDLQGQIPASQCGCAPGELDAYNAMVACVHDPLDGCADECWPSASACSCQ